MRPGFRWVLAGLVTVAVFAVVTWIFADVVAPLWTHDGGARLGWGFGAGTAAAALAALGGSTYATAGTEPGAAEGGQAVENSVIEGGITQVSDAGSVKITRRGATSSLPQIPPAPPAARTPQADLGAAGRQRVSGTAAAGPLDQVQGVDGEVEMEQ
jgi:hypothetical protein